jgi:hypothetical protein
MIKPDVCHGVDETPIPVNGILDCRISSDVENRADRRYHCHGEILYTPWCKVPSHKSDQMQSKPDLRKPKSSPRSIRVDSGLRKLLGISLRVPRQGVLLVYTFPNPSWHRNQSVIWRDRISVVLVQVLKDFNECSSSGLRDNNPLPSL